MEYTTLPTLKTYLKITDTSRDDELTALITGATAMIDMELGYNLELDEDVVIRVNGMWKNRIVLPQKVNSVSKVEVKDTANSTWREVEVDFITGIVVYLIDDVSPGVKNVRLTCSRGYAPAIPWEGEEAGTPSELPADFERLFCSYCAQLLQKQDQDSEWQIQNKKLDGLSITYFGPSDFKGNDENMVSFKKLLAHYKSFSFASSPL